MGSQTPEMVLNELLRVKLPLERLRKQLKLQTTALQAFYRGKLTHFNTKFSA